MNLKFDWTSKHKTLRIVFLESDGGEIPNVPPTVPNGGRIPLPTKYVGYGAKQRWGVDVYVEDAAGGALAGLTITAEYTDTGTPAATEKVCDDEDVEANTVSFFEKTLTIPVKA